MANWTSRDNDGNGDGKGRKVWGYDEKGSLYDLLGLCPSGMVHYQTVRLFQLDPVDADPAICWPDCFVIKVAKGPRLSCKAY